MDQLLDITAVAAMCGVQPQNCLALDQVTAPRCGATTKWSAWQPRVVSSAGTLTSSPSTTSVFRIDLDGSPVYYVEVDEDDEAELVMGIFVFPGGNGPAETSNE